MKIQVRLSITFILLLVFGVTAVSSYSIMFIRNYLIESGVERIRQDADWMAKTLRFVQKEDLEEVLRELASVSGYIIYVYDEYKISMSSNALSRISVSPMHPSQIHEQLKGTANDARANVYENTDGTIHVYAPILYEDKNSSMLEVIQFREVLYDAVKTVRWIVYSGMFISIGLILWVSWFSARTISRPIKELTDAARDIAEGNIHRNIVLKRNDEFGKLAQSLNQMASTLKADTERMKKINAKQQQFYADITHEVKNPLHTIRASLEMLSIPALDGEKKGKYIQTATNQVDRISRLFKDLLILQRFDADEYFIQAQRFDLAFVTTRLHTWYADQMQQKGVHFVVDDRPHYIHADPDKIEQVFDNIVSNAMKYAQATEIRIDISEKGNLVEVRISDNGIGIAKEHQEKLFDRFYRADKARSRDQGGTGLGLSVVKSILSAHGSEIQVQSVPGDGTTFSFALKKA